MRKNLLTFLFLEGMIPNNVWKCELPWGRLQGKNAMSAAGCAAGFRAIVRITT